MQISMKSQWSYAKRNFYLCNMQMAKSKSFYHWTGNTKVDMILLEIVICNKSLMKMFCFFNEFYIQVCQTWISASLATKEFTLGMTEKKKEKLLWNIIKLHWPKFYQSEHIGATLIKIPRPNIYSSYVSEICWKSYYLTSRSVYM